MGDMFSQSGYFEFFSTDEGCLFVEENDALAKNFVDMYETHSVSPMLRVFLRRYGNMGNSEIAYFSDIFRIHKNALALLVNHGRTFKPKIWDEPPSEIEQGKCFTNSQLLTEGSHLRGDFIHSLYYVEGVASGHLAHKPFLHAWNTHAFDINEKYNTQVAVDITIFALSRWFRYFGLVLSLEELKTCLLLNGNLFPLLSVNNFPKVEEYLTEVFKKREIIKN